MTRTLYALGRWCAERGVLILVLWLVLLGGVPVGAPIVGLIAELAGPRGASEDIPGARAVDPGRPAQVPGVR